MYYQLQKDEALLEMLGRSDTGAFDEIYRRYWVVVFRYAVGKVHTPQIAEDLCQDVFVSLWQRRNAVSIQHLEAYLVQATKFGVLNYIRAKIKDKKYQDLTVAYPNTDNETENNLFVRNLMDAWEKAVAELPEKTQEVFRLSKVGNYSNKEIALQLHLTEKAVEYHITKSFKFLRIQLKDFLLFLLLFLAS
ncbi:sigma-70 family RNA polymerase sigma factor [Ferruginibacter profundus]